MITRPHIQSHLWIVVFRKDPKLLPAPAPFHDDAGRSERVEWDGGLVTAPIHRFSVRADALAVAEAVQPYGSDRRLVTDVTGDGFVIRPCALGGVALPTGVLCTAGHTHELQEECRA